MRENKEDYLVTIQKLYGVTDTSIQELIYKIVVVDDMKSNRLRDEAIYNKFHHYRMIWKDETNKNITYQLTADFDVEFRTVQNAIYNVKRK